jgi:hypothetical protein
VFRLPPLFVLGLLGQKRLADVLSSNAIDVYLYIADVAHLAIARSITAADKVRYHMERRASQKPPGEHMVP